MFILGIIDFRDFSVSYTMTSKIIIKFYYSYISVIKIINTLILYAE